MVTPGENTGADRHHRLTPDQMRPPPASGAVTAGHGPDMAAAAPARGGTARLTGRPIPPQTAERPG